MEPTGDDRYRAWPMIGLGVFVCLAGTATGWVFGAAASLLYGMDEMYFGPVLGAISGAAAGVAWCMLMFAKARELMLQLRPGIVTLYGSAWGVCVGVASAIILHVGFWISVGHVNFLGLMMGLIFGAPAGAVVGLVCGALCAGAAWLTVRRTAE